MSDLTRQLGQVEKLELSEMPELRNAIKQAFGRQVYGKSFLKELFKKQTVLGIREGQQLVSFLIEGDSKGHLGITLLGTLPDFRRRGLAERLLRDALKTSSSKVAVLHTQTSNQQAQKLYLKLGFKIVKRQRFYYFPRIPSSAFKMDKTLVNEA